MFLTVSSRRKRERKIAVATMVVWLTWLGIFCVFEGIALRKPRPVPWTTLSEFAWDTEVNPWMRWALLLGLSILNAHIVGRWPR
jgi:hypothetical protein